VQRDPQSLVHCPESGTRPAFSHARSADGQPHSMAETLLRGSRAGAPESTQDVRKGGMAPNYSADNSAFDQRAVRREGDAIECPRTECSQVVAPFSATRLNRHQRRAILLLWMSTEPRGTLVGVKLSYHFSASQSLLVSEGGVLAGFSTARPRTCEPRLQTEGYGGKSRGRLLALWAF